MIRTRVGSTSAFLLRPIWALFVGLGALLGFAIAKNPRLWIFGNFKGFNDNSRYLFEYVAREHQTVRAVWLARDTRHRDEARSAGYEAETIVSLKGLILAFRAKVAVIQNGSRDLNRAALPSQFVVHLWHGTPFKRILLDSNAESVRLPIIGGILTRLGRAALRASLQTMDMIVAPSAHVGSLLASAFRVDSDRVAVTGTPRTDIILRTANSGAIGKPHRILIAPTWRGSTGQVELLPGFDASAWDAMLARVGAVLVLKLHPLMTDDIGGAVAGIDPTRVEHLPADLDVSPILSDFSVVVTDYSGIAFDFALLKRPIFFVCSDEAEYAKVWGLYRSMHEVVGEVLYTDFEALRSPLERVLDQPVSYPMQVVERLAGEDFLRYHDRENCARVLQEIIKRNV